MAKKTHPTKPAPASRNSSKGVPGTASPVVSTAAAPPVNVPPPPRWLSNSRLHMWLIFLLSSLMYANTLGNQFAIDDTIVINRNMFTQRGVAGIWDILTTDTFYGFFKSGDGKGSVMVSGGRYRPLTLVMFCIESQIFGHVKKDPQGNDVRLDAIGKEYYKGQAGYEQAPYRMREYSAWIGHLVNILLYGALCVVLYRLLLLWLLPPYREPTGTETGQAFFVTLTATLLYAAHPLHVEAVANIKGRDEVLSMLAALLATYWAFRAYYQPKRRIPHIVGALLMFLVGLFAKESPMTFAVVIPMAFYFFARTPDGTPMSIPQSVMRGVPFLVVALLFWFGVRAPILGQAASMSDANVRELMNNPFLKLVNGVYVPFDGHEKLATVMQTWWIYLKLLLVPYPLCHDYYPLAVPRMTFASPTALLSLLLHLGALGWAVWQIPRRHPVAFAVLYYLATFSIVSNLIFPIGTNLGERFMFMPSLGFTFMVAWWLSRWNQIGIIPRLALVIVVTIVFTGLTFVRNFDWKDDKTLFFTDLPKVPNSAKLNNACGGTILEDAKGLSTFNNAEQRQQLEDIGKRALVYLDRAIELHPQYSGAWLLRANALYYMRRYDEAIQAYERTRELRPDHEDVNQNLGVTYRDKGRWEGEMNRNIPLAIASLEKALTYLPDDYEAIRLLGVAYGSIGQHDKAISYFRSRIERFPDEPGTWFNLSIAYRAKGMLDSAAVFERRAYEIDPNYKPGQ